MTIPDVNILVMAYRTDAEHHARIRDWLSTELRNGRSFGLPEMIASSFLRIVTNRKIFATPTPLNEALAFIDAIRKLPNVTSLRPGPAHWDLFVDICAAAGAKANLIADAYLAAIAVELDAEFVTLDGDFARFQGLRWRLPSPQATPELAI